MVAPRQLRMIPPGLSAGLIERTGLVPLMEARPVTVLAGIAGYGKSTLLASAAHRMPVDATIWLSLDDSDKDPVRLVADLVTATSVAGATSVTESVEQLRTSLLRAEPLTLVDSLLEALYDTAEPHLLVLDDLQHLAGSPEATSIVDHVLRWAPAGLRIAMAARVVPPLRLQRLRLEDRLTYLSHDDLAFTLQESSAAVRAAGLGLDLAAVTAIQQATDGWPAGIRMAILAARHRGSGTDLTLELRRDQALADYLATEVISSLPTDLRDFVLESCLDERVCPSLIDTIRGTGNAEAMLESCLSAGLFISRGDPGHHHGQWFHWHPLFAAHTQRRLAAERPEVAARLHASAAKWWADVDPPTAVTHALAAGDGELASRIFSNTWLELVLQGRVDAVLAAVERLPHDSAYRGDAHLARALVSVRSGDVAVARAELELARGGSAELSDRDRVRLQERAALVELLVTASEHGLGAAAEAGVTTLERLRKDDLTLDPVVLASVQVMAGMGEARLQNRVDAAVELLGTSAQTARALGLTALELTALAESCVPALTRGGLTEVHDRAVDVLARAEARGWIGLTTLAPAVVYLGWLDYWRGNLHEARAQLERSLSMLLPFDWELRGVCLSYRAKTCLALGDLGAARVSLDEIRTMIDSGEVPAWWPSMLAALESVLLCSERQTGRAVESAVAPPPGPDYPVAPALRAMVLLRAGQPVEALAQLDRRVDEGGGLVQVECLSRCIEAEALAMLGKQDAHLALEQALAAAEPDGLYGPFLSGGPQLATLLKAHLVHGTSHPEMVTQVLGRLGRPEMQHVSAWSEPLTGRERVILRYLATNLTNTEIADAEFISVHTAKTHIAHIYRKLGVNNRRSAIRRAAELDLY